jgi:hypothetical protein
VLPANPFVAIGSTYRWRDLNANRDYDPGEVDLNPDGPDFISSVVRDFNSLTTVYVDNPDEKQPGQDQLSLSVERELAHNLAVRVSGVYVHSFNEPRRLNTLRPYGAYNIPITNPDPGPDGRVGTADDPGTFVTYYDYPAELAGRAFQRTIQIDDPRSNETHKTIEVAMTRRLTGRWQVMASYSATKNDTLAPKPTGTGFPQAANLDPNTEINTGNQTWEWLGRLSAVYVFPGQVTASANFDHRSGVPQARQALFTGGRQIPSIVLNVEPIGSLRLPNTNVTDVRLEKSFSVLSGHKVLGRVSVYNVFNANTITAWNLRSGTTFLRPTAILRPRILEFSGSYTF